MIATHPSRATTVCETVGVWLRSAPLRYPNSYLWFVFVSSLDIVVTWTILSGGGSEVNPVARAVIAAWGLPGAIVFKYTLAIFVILVCEYVGHRRDWLARWLALAAVAVSALPVVYSFWLLYFDFATVIS